MTWTTPYCDVQHLQHTGLPFRKGQITVTTWSGWATCWVRQGLDNRAGDLEHTAPTAEAARRWGARQARALWGLR